MSLAEPAGQRSVRSPCRPSERAPGDNEKRAGRGNDRPARVSKRGPTRPQCRVAPAPRMRRREGTDVGLMNAPTRRDVSNRCMHRATHWSPVIPTRCARREPRPPQRRPRIATSMPRPCPGRTDTQAAVAPGTFLFSGLSPEALRLPSSATGAEPLDIPSLGWRDSPPHPHSPPHPPASTSTPAPAGCAASAAPAQSLGAPHGQDHRH